MKIAPFTIESISPYVNPFAIARFATEGDLHQLGVDLDAAMASLATKTDLYCRDEVVLGLLTVAETSFYTHGWRSLSYDALVAAALDHTVPRYPDTKPYERASLGAVKVAGPWIGPAVDYHAIVGGVINALKGRMKAVVTHGGRTVFIPAHGFEAEVRNRWFTQRWQEVHFQRGAAMVAETPALRKIIPAVDKHVAAQAGAMRRRGRYEPPRDDWYLDVVDAIAVSALHGQFSDIRPSERWGGTSKEMTLLALAPLYKAAARRVFATQRAFRYLRDVFGAEGPLLLSVLEVAPVDDLVAQATAASGMTADAAKALIRSMMRTKGEERQGILDHPLVPMYGDRVVYMPSAILFSAWPAQQQQAIAQRNSSSASVGKARESRHVAEIVEALRKAGYRNIATDVDIVDPLTKQSLTDLDVVAVSDDLASMLIVQLKSYLTPANLIAIDRADRDVADARRQCEVADRRPELVSAAVEQALDVQMPAGQLRRQVIVVEAIAAVDAASAAYPAVSIEWLVDRLRQPLPQGLLQVWEDARDLPDAAAFADSIALAFEVFDDQLRDLKLGRSIAVFGYGADRP